MKRLSMWGWVTGGALIFIIGSILLPMPIPVGAILMVYGLFLMSNHPRVMRWIRQMRAKFPSISERLRRITPHMPGFLARFLNRTDRRNRREKRFTLKRGHKQPPSAKAPGE